MNHHLGDTNMTEREFEELSIRVPDEVAALIDKIAELTGYDEDIVASVLVAASLIGYLDAHEGDEDRSSSVP
jgi:predicted transcriptional regulator